MQQYEQKIVIENISSHGKDYIVILLPEIDCNPHQKGNDNATCDGGIFVFGNRITVIR